MKDYHINIFHCDEDGGYIADTPDLKACSAFGDTPEAALKEVEMASLVGSCPAIGQIHSSTQIPTGDLRGRLNGLARFPPLRE